MKKIVLLTMFVLSGLSLAQTYTPLKGDIKNPSVYSHQASGDTLAPMIFLVNPITVTGGATAANQLSSTNLYSKIGTSVAALDSVGAFGFTSRHIGINNDETVGVVDSTTMYISTTNNFAAPLYKLYAGESLSLDYGTTKLYFKFGSTAKAGKSYRFIVN